MRVEMVTSQRDNPFPKLVSPPKVLDGVTPKNYNIFNTENAIPDEDRDSRMDGSAMPYSRLGKYCLASVYDASTTTLANMERTHRQTLTRN